MFFQEQFVSFKTIMYFKHCPNLDHTVNNQFNESSIKVQ